MAYCNFLPFFGAVCENNATFIYLKLKSKKLSWKVLQSHWKATVGEQLVAFVAP